MTEVSDTFLALWGIFTVISMIAWIYYYLRYQDISKLISDITYSGKFRVVAPWHYAMSYVMKYRHAREVANGYRNALFLLYQSAVLRDVTIPNTYNGYINYLVKDKIIPDVNELPPLIMATEQQCKDDAARFKQALRDNGINPD